MSYVTINVQELHKRSSSGEQPKVIDVRTPAEYRSCHATIAVNFPLERLDPKQIENAYGSKEPVYVLCKSGGRSRQACDKLSAAGLNVINVDGGTMAWEAAGYAVAKGGKVLPLDRQMRIVAGSLAMLGVGLSFVHPAFIYLSGFVGAGLVFAGVTDICPMMMLLAKMPWNQGASGASCSTAPNS